MMAMSFVGLINRTVVDCLLLVDFPLIMVEDCCQRLAYLAHHVFSNRTQLSQIIGLLNESIESANLECWYGERIGGA